MMWAPPDCDLIEFNEFPDDRFYTESHGGTPVRMGFMAGFWAKTLTGRYHNVEASVKNHATFYQAKMRISPRELLDVIATIDNGTLLKPGFTYDELVEEKHTTWNRVEKKSKPKTRPLR